MARRPVVGPWELGFAAVTSAFLLGAWALGSWGGAKATAGVLGVAVWLAPGLAAAAWARQWTRRRRTKSALMAAGMAAWASAALGSAGPVAFGPVASSAWTHGAQFLAITLCALAFVLWLRPVGRGRAAIYALDGFIFFLGGLVVVWAFGRSRMLDLPIPDLAHRLAVAIGCLLITSMAWLTWSRRPGDEQRALSAFAGSATLLALEATLRDVLQPQGFTLLDPLWVAAFLGFAWSALVLPSGRIQEDLPVGSSVRAALLPYVPAMPAAAAMSAASLGHFMGPGLTTLGFAWVTLLIGRQAVLAVSQVILANRLEDALRQEGLVSGRLRLSEAELSRREAWFRALTENAYGAVGVFDREGRRTFLSDSGRRFFGFEPQETLGRPMFEHAHPEDQARADAFLRQVLAHPNQPRRIELRRRRKDGTYVWVETTAVNRLDDPVVGGIITNTTDITDRKLVEEQQRVLQAKEAEVAALRDLERLKTEFFNMAAHELKTPLTPARSILQVLRKRAAQPGREEDAQALEVLSRNVDRFGRLTQDLLDAAKLQANRLMLDPEATDMAGLVQASVRTYSDVAQAAGVTLAYEGPPSLLATVDRLRLAQVVDNFIDNALKFTPPGGRVDAALSRRGDTVRVEVRDTGAGMGPADQARLFEPFSQGHAGLVAQRPGTGLGLYICRGMVELHGGRIGASSAGQGKGATFWFEVPAHLASERAKPAET